MTILKRLNRLVKADLHGIIDSLEEPEGILKQAVRDMEAIIEKHEYELRELARQEETLAKEQQALSKLQEESQQQITLCIREGNDRLARSLVRKKLERNLGSRLLDERLRTFARSKQELEKTLSEEREKYQRIVEKTALFANSISAAKTKDDFEEELSFSRQRFAVSDEDVEVALYQERERWQKDQHEGVEQIAKS